MLPKSKGVITIYSVYTHHVNYYVVLSIFWCSVNPQDVKSTRSSVKDFHFDAEFEGIDIALADEDHDVLQAAVKGRINFSFILPIFSSTHHPSTCVHN